VMLNMYFDVKACDHVLHLEGEKCLLDNPYLIILIQEWAATCDLHHLVFRCVSLARSPVNPSSSPSFPANELWGGGGEGSFCHAKLILR